MAKGDFIFAGVDSTTYSIQQLTNKKHPGTDTLGLTLCYLYVTIELSSTNAKDGEAGDHCRCQAKIVDYELQVNAYSGNNIPKGDALTLNDAHELLHVSRKREFWEAHKAELDPLLNDYSYDCDPDCKVRIIQDVVSWFVGALFPDQKQEEEDAAAREDVVKIMAKSTLLADVMEHFYGKDRLKEHADAAHKVDPAPRFRSEVFPTFKGKCWK